MKCDELKVYVKPLKTNMLGKTIVVPPYYLKSDVDAAFDELKAKLAEKDKEIAELKKQYKDMDVTHTVHIAKMNARIEELEDNEDFWKKEIRRLKRALWLARLRSLKNFSVLAYFQTIRAKGKKSNMDFDEMAYRIDLARVKCRNKAEEFK